MSESDNTIETLRAALFATLKELRDPEKPLKLERAKAINETAQTIINTAKVELQYMELTGGTSSKFLPAAQQDPANAQRRLSGPRRWP